MSSLINEIDSDKLFIQAMLIILFTTFMLIVVLGVIFIYADIIARFLPLIF